MVFIGQEEGAEFVQEPTMGLSSGKNEKNQDTLGYYCKDKEKTL